VEYRQKEVRHVAAEAEVERGCKMTEKDKENIYYLVTRDKPHPDAMTRAEMKAWIDSIDWDNKEDRKRNKRKLTPINNPAI
jgi:hypothetical protein